MKNWRDMTLREWDSLCRRYFYLCERKTLTPAEHAEMVRLGAAVADNKTAFEDWLKGQKQ